MIIYKLTNKINQKCYIGITKQKLSDRLQAHRSPNSNCTKLKYAISKYGWENFECEILNEIESISESLVLESKYITEFNSIENGYNLMLSNSYFEGKRILSPETRVKLSENNFWKGKSRSGILNPRFGKKHTQNTKDKISEANKGKQARLGAILSEETKNKIGKKAKERYLYEVHPRKGCKVSQEIKDKLSQERKGKPSWVKTYIVIFPDGHQQEISNMAEFCRNNNLDKGNMSSVSSGRLKQYKGFKVLNRV